MQFFTQLNKKPTNIIKKRVISNAKINLFLKVDKKIWNNLHDIYTLMIPYYRYNDIIDIEINKNIQNKKTNFILKKSKYHLEQNTVIKAINLLRQKYNIKHEITIKLTKKIPIGSGLGGGSSNAAFLIKSLNSMLELNIKTKDLRNLAFEVGSDAPFFINNKPAIVSNYGKNINNINFKFDYEPIVKVIPETILTKNIYEKYIDKNKYSKNLFEIKNRLSRSLPIIPQLFFNDLQETVLTTHPNLKGKLDKIKKKKRVAIINGSGSSIIYFKKKYS